VLTSIERRVGQNDRGLDLPIRDGPVHLEQRGLPFRRDALEPVALAQLQAQRYDVIVSDLSMPEMDGHAFYLRLRQQFPWLARRVIFLTGAYREDPRVAFLAQRGQPWLAKPCPIAVLRRAIQQVLGRARSAQQLSRTCQELRQRSHALSGKAQTLSAQSARLRRRAALLRAKVRIADRTMPA
jgi:DNA-binding response OmpR family regulator